MKQAIMLLLALFIYMSSSYCEESNITFEVVTDATINCNNEYLPKDIINNCIVAKSKGTVLDKYYSANANILEIESIKSNLVIVKYKKNTNNQTPSSPYWNSGKILLSYRNGKIIQIMKFPEDKGDQSGPVFKLLYVDIGNETIRLKYDYQQYGDARAAGFGTTELMFSKLDNDIFYFSNYSFDVYGHFTKTVGHYSNDDTEGHEAWVPDENGEEIVKRDITKKELARQFAELLTDIWYDSAIVNDVLFVSEKLYLREAEKKSSKIVTTMNAWTEVKILKIGTAETIDGFPGNWCYIEVLENIYKKNEKYGYQEILERSKPTGIKGWCFSAYLK